MTGWFVPAGERSGILLRARIFIFRRSRWGRVPRKSMNFAFSYSLSLSLPRARDLKIASDIIFFVNDFSLLSFLARLSALPFLSNAFVIWRVS